MIRAHDQGVEDTSRERYQQNMALLLQTVKQRTIRIIIPEANRLKYVPSTAYSHFLVKAGCATRVSNRGKRNNEGV